MLRYPGGKLRLMKKIDVMIKNVYPQAYTSDWIVNDPFVGGGGSLINMAKDFPLWKFHLNDNNKNVASLWKLFKTDRNADFEELYDMINKQNVTVDTYNEIFRHKPDSPVERAFRVIFLNKASYNGYVTACLPIGGQKQKSAWNVDVYWTPKNIIKQIERVRVMLENRILSVSFDDFETFMNRNKCDFLYADPPYIKYGKQWYNCDFGIEDLDRLKRILYAREKWCLSIDRSSETEKLFSDSNLLGVDIKHTAKSSYKSRRNNPTIDSSNEIVAFPANTRK